MKRVEFRNLRPDDIEVRPATIKNGKATLLCYIDSRSVVELMDSAVGPLNWNFELVQVGDQVVGKMGVWDENKGTWVVKSDTGSESNIEAGKGLVSDIYKRCIARWGLQDLYTVPRIEVEDDGYGCKWQVSEVSWDENRNCTHITLTNKFGKVMFTWDKDKETKPVQKEKKSNCDILKEFCGEKKREEGIDKDELLRFWNYYCPKMDGWDNTVQPDKLWKRWLETKRSSN